MYIVLPNIVYILSIYYLNRSIDAHSCLTCFFSTLHAATYNITNVRMSTSYH